MSTRADVTPPSPESARGRGHLSRGLVAAVAALVVVAGLGGAAVGAGIASHDRSDTMMGNPQTGRSWQGGEEGFLADMVAHHEEAVAAAGELQRSERPQMRAFGRRIVTSQTAQVDQMSTWSSEWYGGASSGSDYRPMMRDLTELDGDRLDEVFLVDMTQHHMMAVMMARQLLSGDTVEHEEVGSLARTIIREQTAEIAQMHRWSNAWFGRTWYDEGMMSDGPMMGDSGS